MRGTTTRPAPSGLEVNVVATMRARAGTVVETTAAIAPSPHSTAEARTASETTRSTNGGNASGRINVSTCSCAKKLVHAELTSRHGASMPSARATLHASAGVVVSMTDEPVITIPTAAASMPARASAISAARRPASAWV